MADDRGRPPKYPSRPELNFDRPTWTVTRRERTQLSPLRSNSPFHSRTVTTTERVQILQMPVDLRQEQIAPAQLLARSPNGNMSQSVSSTVTTMQAEGTPIIGGLTESGVPLFNGILLSEDSRQTTTIITTTTTTYRVLEVSDSDSMSDDFEIVDDSSLTVDISLPEHTSSPLYMILGKSETVSPISPTTRARMNIDLDFTPRTINKASELNEKPIDELVSVYHCGISFQDPEKLPKTEMPTVEHTQFVANDQIATTSRNLSPIISNNYLDTFETRKLPKDDIITTFSEQSKGPSINSPKNIPSIETNVIQQDGFKQPIKPKEAKLELFKYENNETEGNHHKYSISEAKFNTPQQNTNTSASINEIPKQKKVHGEQKYSMTLKSKRDIMNEITKHTKFETYQGPLDNTVRASDVEGEPLTQHVSVYHTGRSDDVTVKPQEPHIDIADTAKSLGDKITGLFKKGPAHLDHPTSETYKGPLDNTVRVSGEPFDFAASSGERNSGGSTYLSSSDRSSLVNLDIHLNVVPGCEGNGDAVISESVVLSADRLINEQQPLGFSVSISARQPINRSRSELFSSEARECFSDTRFLREQRGGNNIGRERRLSPHTWTTVREQTKITYTKRVAVQNKTRIHDGCNLGSESQVPRSLHIKRVPYASDPKQHGNSCRWTSFDDRVLVHHPIYPPDQSPYTSGEFVLNDLKEDLFHKKEQSPVHQKSTTYIPVQEVESVDRMEYLHQNRYIPPNRRSDEIFTIGTPFIMGRVEKDKNGCEYLRYKTSGLNELPLTQRINELPMIEDGAIECRRATVRAGLRDIETTGHVDDEDDLERRQRPIRRARQRIRNYCTML